MIIIHTFGNIKIAHSGAPERRKIGTATQRTPQIACQGPYISSLTTGHTDGSLHGCGVKVQQFDGIDAHFLGFQHHFLSRPAQ